MSKVVSVQSRGRVISVSQNDPFLLIAGPCQIESLDHALDIAGRLDEMCTEMWINLVYKSSFDKANRSSLNSKRGVGLDEGLKILEAVSKTYDLSILTDIHTPEQCDEVASVCDIIQIPAFLSRQTDLLLAAGQAAVKHNAAINVKKGQWMAPGDMTNVAAKIESTGCENIMLCDRGTSFGYNTLVTDFRGIPIMAQTGYPVVFDATHSVQQPGGNGATSGGQREFVPTLARAAAAVGVGGMFIETHEDPDNAPSDGPNMIPIHEMPALLEELVAIDNLKLKRAK